MRWTTGLPFVALEGAITRDPELRYTTSGKAVASLSVVCKDRKRGANGEYEDTSETFIDVTVWGTDKEKNPATNLIESVRKGDMVNITGRLIQENWETQQGDKRSKLKVIADEVGVSVFWAPALSERAREDSVNKPAAASSAPPADDPWGAPQTSGPVDLQADEPPF